VAPRKRFRVGMAGSLGVWLSVTPRRRHTPIAREVSVCLVSRFAKVAAG